LTAERREPIALVAFDFFGTLVQNEVDEWILTLGAIAREQGLPLDGATFHAEWSKSEVQFRRTRTDMADPSASPPFKTYWEAWRDAFRATLDAMGLAGDADAAATRCVDDLVTRAAFPDVDAALVELAKRSPLAVMSNADDRFLDGSIARNGWRFDTVVSSESARAYKPDPRAFQALLEAAHLAPEGVLYVGDSPYDDAHGAKLAGMRSVLLRRDQKTPGRTPPPEAETLLLPDYEIGSLADLAPLLDTLL
jgi:2-haloacid dehalogenase